MSVRVVLFTLGATLATTLLIGSLPALQLGSVLPQSALRSVGLGATPTKWSSRTRAGLLVAQMAAAVFLATCAGLLVRSFAAVQRVDLGFRPDGLLTFSVTLPQDDRPRTIAFYEELADRLRQLPQVISTGAVNMLPLSDGNFGWGFEVQDKPGPAGTALPAADVRIVTPDALRAMDVPLLKGRPFERTDRAGGEPVTIVNMTFARQTWASESPLGKRIKLAGPGNPWMRVVGVVADVHFGAPDSTPAPAIYRPHPQHPWRGMAVVVRTVGPIEAAVPAVRGVVRSVDADAVVLDVRDFTYYLSRSVAQRRIVTIAMASFAAVANVLALAGVYALFAYVVALRTREIGIRLALGARRYEIAWLVVRQALALCLVGLTLGFLASASARRVLESHLFNVAPTDMATLGTVSLAVVLAALVASYVPARRASSVDLTTTLRME